MKSDVRTAFVAMPFSVPHMARHYSEPYAPLLKTLELKPLRAWGGFGTEDYEDLLYTLIDRCGAMLADIATLNPNEMHEVGHALGKGNKFVILLAEKGQDVPANLGDFTAWRAGRWGLRRILGGCVNSRGLSRTPRRFAPTAIEEIIRWATPVIHFAAPPPGMSRSRARRSARAKRS